jgi:UDP-GlcNAc:undecaprenyl-phosphate/decaprenyl-phosphate GlcNAc-1-phosphate transferase
MNQLAWLALASFVFTVILTPIVRDLFRSYKVVDEPDQNRKVHVYPIPRVGGIGIAIAYVLTIWLVRPNGTTLDRELSLVVNILPGAGVIFAIGVIDDFFALKPLQKLVGQFLAAALAVWAGVMITSVAGRPLHPVLGAALTIGWLLVCTNAFNLVDGLDGLAAGVGLFATLTTFTTALLQGNEPLAYATLPLAGCLLGFLCFNFNPATVFLGDSGSLLIGFFLGSFGVMWSQKSVTLLGMTAPLMAMSLPLVDVLLCIIRRWLRDQPIFSADRGHIHHRLLDRGLTPRQAVLLLYALCGLAAGFSLVQSFANDIYISAFVVVLFSLAAWLGIHQLGYTEFVLAGSLLRSSEFQQNISAKLGLINFENALRKARTPDECWNALLNACPMYGFIALRLQFAGAFYTGESPAVAGSRCVIRVPLLDGDYVELAREVGSSVLPMAVMPFCDLLAGTLSEKLVASRSINGTAESERPGLACSVPEN